MDQFKAYVTQDKDVPVEAPDLTWLRVIVAIAVVVFALVWILL